MWIVNLTANKNGSHNNHKAYNITTITDGWAMIPEGFAVPDTFPFVDIEAAELTYTREVEVEKEVTKTQEVEAVDENGNPITITEEYTERETVMEQRPYTMMTVTAMTEGFVPPTPEPEPTWNDQMEEQVNNLEETTAALEDAICEMDEANDERMAAIEDALCEMDMG